MILEIQVGVFIIPLLIHSSIIPTTPETINVVSNFSVSVIEFADCRIMLNSSITMTQPDQAWSSRDKGGPWRTFYRKQFNKNISTKDTSTTHHRVIINTADSSKNTQFPLSFKN